MTSNMKHFLNKVYGEFRVAVKMLLMWNSKITINDSGDTIDASSVLEVRNLAVLRVRL